MAQIIQPFSTHIEVRFEHFFQRKGEPGSGYGFPCTESGEPLIEADNKCAWDNYREQKAGHPDYRDTGIQRYQRRVKNHAELQCDCRRTVVLAYADNDCECGRVYNLFGQSLRTNYTKQDEMEEFSYGDWNNWG